MSSQTFADLGISSAVLSALTARGIKEPFPIQRLAVPDVLAGRDVLVKSPTGSGKTLAFGVPIVDLIEATSRALRRWCSPPPASSRCRSSRTCARWPTPARCPSHRVYGGAGIHKQAKLASNAHIVVATPGRLEDLIDSGAIRLYPRTLLVLDEADRMLDMGFRPAVDRIVSTHAAGPPDAVLLGHARRRGGQDRLVYTHDAATHEHTVRAASSGPT